MILGTHVYLSAFSVRACCSVDVFTRLVSTDKAYTTDVGVFANVSDCVFSSLNHVYNAIRYTSLLEQVNQQLSGSSHTFGGLQNVGVT